MRAGLTPHARASDGCRYPRFRRRVYFNPRLLGVLVPGYTLTQIASTCDGHEEHLPFCALEAGGDSGEPRRTPMKHLPGKDRSWLISRLRPSCKANLPGLRVAHHDPPPGPLSLGLHTIVELDVYSYKLLPQHENTSTPEVYLEHAPRRVARNTKHCCWRVAEQARPPYDHSGRGGQRLVVIATAVSRHGRSVWHFAGHLWALR